MVDYLKRKFLAHVEDGLVVSVEGSQKEEGSSQKVKVAFYPH